MHIQRKERGLTHQLYVVRNISQNAVWPVEATCPLNLALLWHTADTWIVSFLDGLNWLGAVLVISNTNPLVVSDVAGVGQLAGQCSRSSFRDFTVNWNNKTLNVIAEDDTGFLWAFLKLKFYVNLLLATTSCTVRVCLCLCITPEHLYLPLSSGLTSFRLTDMSQGSWEENEDGEKAGRRPRAKLKWDPGFSFSQLGEDGAKSVEKTQGRVAADPTAAYTLVLSSGGWTIPLREIRTGRTF